MESIRMRLIRNLMYLEKISIGGDFVTFIAPKVEIASRISEDGCSEGFGKNRNIIFDREDEKDFSKLVKSVSIYKRYQFNKDFELNELLVNLRFSFPNVRFSVFDVYYDDGDADFLWCNFASYCNIYNHSRTYLDKEFANPNIYIGFINKKEMEAILKARELFLLKENNPVETPKVEKLETPKVEKIETPKVEKAEKNEDRTILENIEYYYNRSHIQYGLKYETVIYSYVDYNKEHSFSIGNIKMTGATEMEALERLERLVTMKKNETSG